MTDSAEDTGELLSLEGSVLVDRYRVDKLLGRGGMGAVFKGHQLTLKRDVAIKVLHPDLTRDEQITKRFEREAQSTAVLEHPNIVRILEFGTTEAGFMFIVMQLLEGHELDELIGQPIPQTQALAYIIQVLRALDHAHRHGIVHRDLKPENIFVVHDDEGREVLKLVDFGIAKIVGGGGDRGESATPMTKLGMVFGTPQYMSPEQATGMETDARTDIYSAGLILYAMLAGHPPFEAEDPVSLIRMQVGVEPPPLPGHISPGVQSLVARMVAKSRDARFQSAADARQAAETLLAQLLSASGAATSPEMIVPAGSGAIDLTPVHGIPQTTAAGGSYTPVPHDSSHGNTPVQGVPAQHPADISSVTSVPPVPVAQTVPPAMGRNQIIIASAIGGAVVVLGLVLWASFGGSDEDASDEVAGVLDAAGEDMPVSKAAPEKLAEIERLLSAKNTSDALAVIQPLRDEFPDDPILLWKAGRALSFNKKSTKDRSRALHRYFEALEQSRALLKDPSFYAELYELLRDPKLRDEAVNLALQDLGDEGHEFLLEQINEPSPSRALGYVDRHRVIDALMANPSNEELIDWDLNLARDLWQSRKSRQPCTAFDKALDEIAERPSFALYERLRESKVPKAGEGEVEIVCTKAEAKLGLLLTKFDKDYSTLETDSDAAGDGDDEPKRTEANPDDLQGAGGSGGGSSKGGGGSGSKKKREKNPFKKGFWK